MDLERLGHRRSIDDFSGIEQILRIEGAFDLAECLIERRAEKFLIEVAARQPIAMLAGHGAIELQNQIGDRIGDGNHFVDFALAPLRLISGRMCMQPTEQWP